MYQATGKAALRPAGDHQQSARAGQQPAELRAARHRHDLGDRLERSAERGRVRSARGQGHLCRLLHDRHAASGQRAATPVRTWWASRRYRPMRRPPRTLPTPTHRLSSSIDAILRRRRSRRLWRPLRPNSNPIRHPAAQRERGVPPVEAVAAGSPAAAGEPRQRLRGHLTRDRPGSAVLAAQAAHADSRRHHRSGARAWARILARTARHSCARRAADDRHCSACPSWTPARPQLVDADEGASGADAGQPVRADGRGRPSAARQSQLHRRRRRRPFASDHELSPERGQERDGLQSGSLAGARRPARRARGRGLAAAARPHLHACLQRRRVLVCPCATCRFVGCGGPDHAGRDCRSRGRCRDPTVAGRVGRQLQTREG